MDLLAWGVFRSPADQRGFSYKDAPLNITVDQMCKQPMSGQS